VVLFLRFQNPPLASAAISSRTSPKLTTPASVYVALTADVSRSRTSIVNAPHAIESPALTSHLPDVLAHGGPHHEILTDKNLRPLVLHRGNLRKQRSMLDALLRRLRRVVVRFLPLILIGPNGKSCTLFLLKKALLIVLNV
jgi:hypothetical protein